MTITVTKHTDTAPERITIDLHNDSNGNDLNINTTPEDARILAEKILEALL